MAAILRTVKKAELQALGKEVDLQDYLEKNVADLRTDLEEQINKNKTALVAQANKSPTLSAILDKIGGPSRSPTKRQSAPEKVQDSVTSGDEAAPKKGRRKTVAPGEETTSSITDMIKTPAKDLADALVPRRSSILASPGNLDTSPRAVVDYLDRNTRKVSGYVSDSLARTHVSEYSDKLREILSSPLAFNGLVLGVEMYYLFFSLVDFRHAFGLPMPFGGKVVADVRLPDLFALITPEFWGPFSLFFLTTVILPAVAAYFVNYPLRSATRHGHNTRRSAAQHDAEVVLDPFVFNVAKAVISYLVYAASAATGVGYYGRLTVQTVNAGLPFGYSGLITSSIIGATIALYEAVLKK